MSLAGIIYSKIVLKKIIEQITAIVLRRQQLLDLNDILNITIREVREILGSNRVIIYRFLPDGDGVVAEESVSPEWKPILGQLIYDPCFQAKWVEQYRQGQISLLEDIDAKSLEPCYRELLTKLQIRANLVVPILVEAQEGDGKSTSPHLWGLLIAHQCASPRQWDSAEIKFLQLVAAQVGIAIEQLQQRSLQLNSPPRELAQATQELTTANIPQESLSPADLRAFDRLQTPIWIYDLENLQMWWANRAALRIWNAESREELLNSNLSEVYEFVGIHLPTYLEQFQQGKTIANNWTFYPEGKPVTVNCVCSGIQIEPGRMGMLVEGTREVADRIDGEILRSIDAMRHTTEMVSLYTMDGVPLMQNPAALRCYGETLHPNPSTVNAFLRRFVNSAIGERAMETILSGEVFHTDTQVFTAKGIRWHSLDIRCTRDPVTDNSAILVNEKDITKLQVALQEKTWIEEKLRWKEALLESEERYRSLIAAMAEGIVLQQADGRITTFNERAEKILGLTAEQMMGRTSIDPRWRAIHEDGSPFPGETHPAMVTLRTGEPQFGVVMGVYKPDGSLSWISINSQALFQFGQSKPYAVVTSFTDITVRKQAEQALYQQTEKERMIYAIAQHIRQSLDLERTLNTTVAEVRRFLQTDRVIIYRFNPDWSGVVVKESVAEGWLAILNMEITDTYFVEREGQWHTQTAIKVTPDIYTAGFDPCHVELLERLQVRAKLVVPILQNDRLWGLLVAHHCSAPREWLSWEIKLLQQLATQIAIAIQQSELHQQLQIANQQLANLALIDQLTQVANRRCFDDTLNREWHDLMEEKRPLSLILCDIDYFKRYNDTYGHPAGDTCLKLVAQAIHQTVQGGSNLVARYGGEEFAAILPNTNSKAALQVARKIHQAVAKLQIAHSASAVDSYVSLSVGIATGIPIAGMTPVNLIEAADRALYQAKAHGRNRIWAQRFSPFSP